MSPNRVPLPPVAHLGFGQVRHTRLRPSAHAFAYDTFYALLPMRQLAAAQDARAHAQVSAGLAINRRGWLSFHDQDHGDGRGPEAGGALAWLDALLQSEGITDATGEVWLHTYPRVLGYVFKPVSFWYAHDGQGQLRAIVVEVNNTFGERHCYLLETPAWGQSLQARKVFHVSPFCAVEGHYTFRFFYTAQQGIARIEHHDAQGPLLLTSVSGELTPATSAMRRRALLNYPLLTLGVIARIHWQALLLWRKRVPFFRKPEPPNTFVTR